MTTSGRLSLWSLLAVACWGGCGGGNLIAAVGHGDMKTVANILKRRPQRVNERDKLLGWSPLYMAVQQNNEAMVTLLLEKGADPAQAPSSGETPLHVAAKRGELGIARQLLLKGAPIEARTSAQYTPLLSALNGGAVQVAALLLERGADPKARAAGGMTTLHHAAMLGSAELVQRILQCGVEVSVATSSGVTPLHTAARFGRVDVVQLLLQHKAAVDVRDKQGRTPLHHACEGSIRFMSIARFNAPPRRIPHFVGSPVTVELLLRSGAQVNARDASEQTPLHLAAWHGYRDVVRVLLDRGADPNARDKGGETPLHGTARGYELALDNVTQHTCNPAVARMLVERGAQQVRDERGRTPLQVLSESCRKNGVEQAMLQARPTVDVDRLQQACDKGEVAQCVALGQAFHVGKGVARDHARAAGLYRKACDGGSGAGCNKLGVLTKDEVRAAALFEQACKGKYAWGCFNLAKAYHAGQGVKQDSARAAEYFARGCEGGHFESCNRHGVLLANGKGVKKDPAGSANQFRKACDGGFAWGCYNLGVAYQDKNGVQRDLARAAALYRRACDGKIGEACNRLGVMQAEGNGVPKDPAGAAALYRAACDAKLALGCRNLGVLYKNGLGLPRDPARATALFRQACSGGYREACTEGQATSANKNPSAVRPASSDKTPPPGKAPASDNCAAHRTYRALKYTVTVQQKARQGKSVGETRTVAVRRSELLGILARLQLTDHPALQRTVRRLVRQVERAPRVQLFGGADASLSGSLQRELSQTMQQVATTCHCE